MKKKYLEAGRIVNTHGVHGEVRLEHWADDKDFFAGLRRVFIDDVSYKLLAARPHKNCLILSLEGVRDVNAAMRLKGKTLFIDREDVSLPDGVFFLQDILGARAVTEDGAELGTLSDVMELPGGRVYVIQGDREYLIPDVPEFILNADPENGLLTVRLIEGM